ncbi:MAG: STAS domain-containing protein [Chloroflexales bacterium]|nr:STAS domain-containing protein [Chloroflexales bacterium]
MFEFLARLTTVHSVDADIRRRGQIVTSLALIMIVAALLSLPTSVLAPDPLSVLIRISSSIAIFILAFFLARAGHILISTSLIILINSLVVLTNILSGPAGAISTPFFLTIPVFIASITLRPAQIWLVLAANLLGLTLVILMLPASTTSMPLFRTIIPGSYLLIIIVGLIGTLGASTTGTALRDVQAARSAAEQAKSTLQQINNDLEKRVTERTAALTDVLAAQQAMTADLQTSLAAQQQLNVVIALLSLPIIPVRDDVLVVPLIGNLDSSRANQLITTLLEEIERSHARTVMLDVTGVPIVDTQVAKALLQTTAATRLMGAETVLVGIRPEVAQALVSLGVDLSSLRTAAKLQDGLAQLTDKTASSAVSQLNGSHHQAFDTLSVGNNRQHEMNSAREFSSFDMLREMKNGSNTPHYPT